MKNIDEIKDKDYGRKGRESDITHATYDETSTLPSKITESLIPPLFYQSEIVVNPSFATEQDSSLK